MYRKKEWEADSESNLKCCVWSCIDKSTPENVMEKASQIGANAMLPISGTQSLTIAPVVPVGGNARRNEGRNQSKVEGWVQRDCLWRF